MEMKVKRREWVKTAAIIFLAVWLVVELCRVVGEYLRTIRREIALPTFSQDRRVRRPYGSSETGVEVVGLDVRLVD